MTYPKIIYDISLVNIIICQSLGGKINNDYSNVSEVKKGIIFDKNKDGSYFTMRPHLPSNLFQITKNDVIGLISLDSSGNVGVKGSVAAKDYVTDIGVSLNDLYRFNPYSATVNGICSDALLISTTSYHDYNRPQIVSIQNTSSLPPNCRFGIRLVFVLDSNNVMVVIIGRGIASESAGLNIWLNQYTVSSGWAGWKALS